MIEATLFGSWLHQRRRALDLTQAELAQRVGCATVTIHKIEIEERRPSKAIAERLAEILQITPAERTAFLRFARGETAAIQPTPLPPHVLPVPTVAPVTAHVALPVPITPLLGREDQVTAVCDLLCRPEVRLMTLMGPGGIGKTRLALQVAAELSAVFAHGAVFVALAPTTDPVLVLPTLMHTLGLTETGNQPLQEQLIHYLREKQLLLVLDNMEHLLMAAPLISTLLTAVPSLTVLVTSRVVLHLQGEYEFPVPPLALPDLTQLPSTAELPAYSAIQLFCDRAQAVNPGFQLTDATSAAVAQICVRLDGIPLAIELAAARSKILSPSALLARLHQRLPVLTGGARDLPARQQTLRATIDWSYHLLARPEQTLFARLAVFVGEWTLEAAEVVCQVEGDLGRDVLDLLQALLDHTLLQSVDDEHTEPRFTMLETIREYALEQVEARGEAPALVGQHAAYYLALAEAIAPELVGTQSTIAREQLAMEYPNLRAALKWMLSAQEIGLALRLSGALCNFWLQQYAYTEGRQWLAAVRDLDCEGHDPVLRGKVAFMAGTLAEQQGDYGQAQVLLEESLTLNRAANDTLGIARTLNNLALLAYNQEQFAQAQQLFEESLDLSRAAGSTWSTGFILCGLGRVALDQGQYVHARLLIQEALDLGQAAHLPHVIANALSDLGDVAYAQGHYEEAQTRHTESLRVSWEMRDHLGSAVSVERVAAVAGAQGDSVRAARLFAAATTVYTTVGWTMPRVYRTTYERDIAIARAPVNDATWAAAWAEGHVMSLAQAVAYALRVDTE